MNPIELLKNLYFGDRWCEKIVINNKDRTLELHVDRISRLRPGTEQWDYYTEEDIPHGIVLFTGVKEIIFNPSGMVPNDEIYDVYAKWVDEENKYMFYIEACNFNEDLVSNDVRITFLGDDVFIIDPNKQGK